MNRFYFHIIIALTIFQACHSAIEKSSRNIQVNVNDSMASFINNPTVCRDSNYTFVSTDTLLLKSMFYELNPLPEMKDYAAYLESSFQSPSFQLISTNLDQDAAAEKIIMAGDKSRDYLFFVLLDQENNVYKIKFAKEVYNKGGQAKISTIANDMVHLYEGGSTGTGISSYDHVLYQLREGKVYEVFRQDEKRSYNGPIHLETSASIVEDSLEKGKLKVFYISKLQICASDMVSTPQEEPMGWYMLPEQCSNSEVVSLLDKTYSFSFAWNKDSNRFVQTGNAKDKEQYDLLNTLNTTEPSLKSFYKVFDKDIQQYENKNKSAKPYNTWLLRMFKQK